jgi:hypothetical protein
MLLGDGKDRISLASIVVVLDVGFVPSYSTSDGGGSRSRPMLLRTEGVTWSHPILYRIEELPRTTTSQQCIMLSDPRYFDLRYGL